MPTLPFRINEKEKMEDDDHQEEDRKPAAPTSVMVPDGGVHPVCRQGSSYGRSGLHRAVCDMDIVSLRHELSSIASGNLGMLTLRDELGYTPLHSACSLGMLGLNRPDVPCEIVLQLVAAGADASCEDENGNTALHWSARAGDKNVTELLLRRNCKKGVYLRCRAL
jgi:ankyrin repeat protein